MRRLPAILLALGVPLAALAQAPPPAAPPAGPVVVAPGLALPRLQDLAATRERPLFSPTRRPPPPPPPPRREEVAEAPVEVPPPAEPEQPPPFVLAGVVTGSSLTLAMLQNRDTSEVSRVRRGDELLGWTVTEVGTTHVMLQRDGRTVRLALFEKKEPPDPAAAPKAPSRTPADEDEEEEDE